MLSAVGFKLEGVKEKNELHKKFRKLILYAGVDKEEYTKLLPGIRKENEVLLRLFSLLAATMFFILTILSTVSGGFATVNSPTYLISGIIMLLIFLCVQFIVPKHPEIIMMLVYVFEIVLYAFGIHISMLHADKPAVSAVAFLLVSPLLFYDRPIRLSALLAAVIAAFCTMVLYFKQPNVAGTDVWNMITFGIVAIAATLFIMNIKIRTLSQSRQIEYLSQTDLLTGVKNRNHFENRIKLYPEMCKSNLICIYGDVNGLHELNNNEGHRAGDKMLSEVAARIQQRFGSEHTYRIGGDEFAAFELDGQPEKVLSDIERITQNLDKEGYHISFGISVWDKTEGNMDVQELVEEAEHNMYSVKREFYSRSGSEQRNRSTPRN